MKALIRLGLIGAAVALLQAGLFPAVAAAHPAHPGITSYALTGSAVFPEGIAFNPHTGNFFVSSTSDGSIQRGNVKSALAVPFIPASGVQFSSIGLELHEGHLAVAGGLTGTIRIYDEASGSPIRTFTTGAGGFLNDLAAARNGDLYVTDSTRPTIWRVATANIVAGTPIAAEAWLNLNGTAIVYQSGFNLNGIVVTPNNKFLIVAQTNTGKLFRIDLATRAVSQIDLAGELVAGDGLVLRGHTLWAVADGKIVKVRLGEHFGRGKVRSRTADPSFSSPTTAAIAHDRLLVVNSQFANMGGTPTLPFTVSSIEIP